jgi:hypothetical protein
LTESEKEKLIKLLNYWIEHNSEHRDEFREWIEKTEKFIDISVRSHLLEATQQMDKVNEFLILALKGLKEEEG